MSPWLRAWTWRAVILGVAAVGFIAALSLLGIFDSGQPYVLVIVVLLGQVLGLAAGIGAYFWTKWSGR